MHSDQKVKGHGPIWGRFEIYFGYFDITSAYTYPELISLTN